jgi:predicted transcriptional regulator
MEDKDTRAKRLLRLDPDLYEKLKALAKINRRSANNEIELAIAEYVDRELQEEETV